MTLAGLVFAAITVADPLITKDFGAARVEEIVAALAEETGTKLTTSTNLVNDVLFVSLKETPFSEVKEILARQTGGSWVERNGFTVLEAAAEKGNLDDLMSLRAIESWFDQYKEPDPITKEAVTSAIRALSQAEQGNPDVYPQKQIESLNRLAPVSRALNRIVRSIGKDFLVAMPEGGRAVFSSQPTPMQRPFPAAAVRAIDQFRTEYVAYSQMVSSAASGVAEGRYYVSGLQGIERGPAQISEFEVVISRLEYGITAELKVPDPKGEYYILTEQTMLNPNLSNPEDRSKGQAERMKTLPLGKDQAELPADMVPAEVREISSALTFSRQGPRKPLSASARKMILEMDKVDLFGKMAEPYLRALAKRSGKSFITPVSDFVFMEMASPNMNGELAKKLTYAQIAAALGASMMGQMLGDLEWKETDRAIEFRSTDPRAARGQRIQRRIVARYLRSIESKMDKLDADADLAVANPGQVSFQFAMIFASALTSQTMNLVTTNLPVLRLYGSLSQSERLMAKSEGITINLSGLGPPLEGRVNALIFGNNPALQQEAENGSAVARKTLTIDPAHSSGPPNEYDWDDTKYRWGSGAATPKMEVTRALAGGVPLRSTLFIQVESRPRIFGFSKEMGGGNFANPVTSQSLGWALAYREKNPGTMTYGYADTFRLGRSRVLKVEFRFPGTGTMSRGAVLDEVDTTSKELKFADLPESFRKKANEALEDARRNQNFSPPGTGVKPPLG
jgi:hypothetical protein